MTDAVPPQNALILSLFSDWLALPDTADLLDPLCSHLVQEVLNNTNAEQDNRTLTQIRQIIQSGRMAIQKRNTELRHEIETLNRLTIQNRDVLERLDQCMDADKALSQSAWKSFSIARKIVAREGSELLNLVSNKNINQMIANNLDELLNSATTSALTQSMQSLITEAFTLLENFERRSKQIMNVVEAVYARFNELPNFNLALPQLSDMENYRHDLQYLSKSTTEFCRRPMNLITDQSSLAKKFGLEITTPLRIIFTQLHDDTHWWLTDLSQPVQDQIQAQKMDLEKRKRNITLIQDQISIFEARTTETEATLARLQQQAALTERLTTLIQDGPFANPD